MEKLSPPTITPSSGTFDVSKLDVEIISAQNVEIFYAINESPKLMHFKSRPPGHQGCPWRNTFYSPVKIRVDVPGEVKARAFTVRDGKEVLSDVAVAAYVWSKVQFGIIVSVSATEIPHSWRVHYAYKSDDGEHRETIIVVGRDVFSWISPAEPITVPTPPGVTGIMKLECPPSIKWSTFGIGNHISGDKHFFLASQ